MMPDDVLDKLRTRIAARVREGFDSREGIIEGYSELAESDYGLPGLEPVVTQMTDELLRLHRLDQERWTEPTDCDRLDDAFEGLERRGLVARQHFT